MPTTEALKESLKISNIFQPRRNSKTLEQICALKSNGKCTLTVEEFVVDEEDSSATSGGSAPPPAAAKKPERRNHGSEAAQDLEDRKTKHGGHSHREISKKRIGDAVRGNGAWNKGQANTAKTNKNISEGVQDRNDKIVVEACILYNEAQTDPKNHYDLAKFNKLRAEIKSCQRKATNTKRRGNYPL